MDEQRRELERRAQQGDRQAKKQLLFSLLRTGEKRLAHNWHDYKDYPKAEDEIRILQAEGYWTVIYGGHAQGHWPTRAEAERDIRLALDICPFCKTEFVEESSLCCHCKREEFEDFIECKLCDLLLCTEDPCIPCDRIEKYKEIGYPDLYGGRRNIWVGTPSRSEYCGMCATDLTRSGDTEIHHRVSYPYLFRCDSCGQRFYPDPANDKNR